MQSVNGTVFNIGERYEALKFMGAGAYGAVIKASDKQTGEYVAIKKLHKIEDIVDAKRILRELRILRLFKHENIINLHNVIFNEEKDTFGEIYLVTNLMEIDLYAVIKNKQALTDDHIQFIIYQIVRALLYLHSANIIHRDLKPSNILATETCDVQICDFGLSRAIDFSADENRTEYVVTRYYRAPEIMISHEYSTAVDLWSLGCTMAELMTGHILFKGENYIQQIKLMVDTLGKPGDMSFVTNPNAKKFLDTLPENPKRPLLTVCAYDNPEAIDLLQKLLTIDPVKRISAGEAIKHPYLKAFHEPSDEPIFKAVADFKFENDPKLTLDDTLLLILDEINYFRKLNKAKEFDREKYVKLFKSKAEQKK
jgi:mitogen-activated protein kinase 1/3